MFRLRKWIILRLVSIVDNLHVEKEEALIEEVARYGPEMCLNPDFHGAVASCLTCCGSLLEPKA